MADSYQHLPTIGFTISDEGAAVRLSLPDGKTIPQVRHSRIQHMDGRLDNIAYMAREIDRVDGIEASVTKRSAGGTTQFHHLLQHDPASALIYLALRRLQRAGQLPALRAGLTILLAYDHQELTAADAVSYFFPDHQIALDAPLNIEGGLPSIASRPAPTVGA